jgi:hypothetical protein
MKIFIDDNVLREMRAMTQERLFKASPNPPWSASGRHNRAPLEGDDTAQNGLSLVGAIATIYSNYRIETEMLEPQVRPRSRRTRARAP